jgi:hypothetical protein
MLVLINRLNKIMVIAVKLICKCKAKHYDRRPFGKIKAYIACVYARLDREGQTRMVIGRALEEPHFVSSFRVIFRWLFEDIIE